MKELTVTSMVGLPRGERPPLLPSFCDIKNRTALLASSTWIYNQDLIVITVLLTDCLVPIIFNGFSSFVTSAES